MGAGGEIASTFDSPDKLKLGSCKLIEEIMIGEDKLIHFSGVEMGEACTIVLRGASKRLPPCLTLRTCLSLSWLSTAVKQLALRMVPTPQRHLLTISVKGDVLACSRMHSYHLLSAESATSGLQSNNCTVNKWCTESPEIMILTMLHGFDSLLMSACQAHTPGPWCTCATPLHVAFTVVSFLIVRRFTCSG